MQSPRRSSSSSNILVSKNAFEEDARGPEKAPDYVPTKRGYMLKVSRNGKLQQRYFATNNTYLNYYRRHRQFKKRVIRASIDLRSASKICVLIRNGLPSRTFAIQYTHPETHFEECLFLRAPSKASAHDWVSVLNDRRMFWSSLPGARGGGGDGSSSDRALQASSSSPSPSHANGGGEKDSSSSSSSTTTLIPNSTVGGGGSGGAPTSLNNNKSSSSRRAVNEIDSGIALPPDIVAALYEETRAELREDGENDDVAVSEDQLGEDEEEDSDEGFITCDDFEEANNTEFGIHPQAEKTTTASSSSLSLIRNLLASAGLARATPPPPPLFSPEKKTSSIASSHHHHHRHRRRSITTRGGVSIPRFADGSEHHRRANGGEFEAEEDDDEGMESAESEESSGREEEEEDSSSSSSEDEGEMSDGNAPKTSSASRAVTPRSSSFNLSAEGMKRFANLPPPWSRRYWYSLEDISYLRIRGPSYLADHKKMAPLEPRPLFDLMALDLFETKGIVSNIAEHPRNRLRLARERGEAPPFTFVVHFQVPGPPFFSYVCYFVPRDARALRLLTEKRPSSGEEDESEESSSWSLGYQRLFLDFFLGEDDAMRDTHIKMIPRVVEGPYVVRAGVQSKPALIGTKLKLKYFRSPTHLEVCIDVAISTLVLKLTQLALNYSSLITVDLTFLIESKREAELPERVVGVMRAVRPDFKAAVKLTEESPS